MERPALGGGALAPAGVGVAGGGATRGRVRAIKRAVPETEGAALDQETVAELLAAEGEVPAEPGVGPRVRTAAEAARAVGGGGPALEVLAGAARPGVVVAAGVAVGAAGAGVGGVAGGPLAVEGGAASPPLRATAHC